MDKTLKFLNLLSKKQRGAVLELLVKIKALKLSGLNVKPLKGYKDTFRVKKGNLRIIFSKHKDGNGIKGTIITVDYRKDVYRNF